MTVRRWLQKKQSQLHVDIKKERKIKSMCQIYHFFRWLLLSTTSGADATVVPDEYSIAGKKPLSVKTDLKKKKQFINQ
jgi:hypothetical protein